MYLSYRILRRCLISESNNVSFYLSNYNASLVISTQETRTFTRKLLQQDLQQLLCRKLLLTDKGKSNQKYNNLQTSNKQTYNYINSPETTSSKAIINIKSVMSLTATFLDWCHCTHLHTDANMTGNFWMRMSNGNGKVKDELDIQYQNIPGSLGVQEVGTVLDTMVSRLKPDVLFLGEVDSSLTKAACPDGYSWVGGHLKGNHIRENSFQDCQSSHRNPNSNNSNT